MYFIHWTYSAWINKDKYIRLACECVLAYTSKVALNNIRPASWEKISDRTLLSDAPNWDMAFSYPRPAPTLYTARTTKYTIWIRHSSARTKINPPDFLRVICDDFPNYALRKWFWGEVPSREYYRAFVRFNNLNHFYITVRIIPFLNLSIGYLHQNTAT